MHQGPSICPCCGHLVMMAEIRRVVLIALWPDMSSLSPPKLSLGNQGQTCLQQSVFVEASLGVPAAEGRETAARASLSSQSLLWRDRGDKHPSGHVTC